MEQALPSSAVITCSTVVLQCYRRQAIFLWSKPKFDPP